MWNSSVSNIEDIQKTFTAMKIISEKEITVKKKEKILLTFTET